MNDLNLVAPMNMGNRLSYDEKEKRYNVNVDDLIKRIEALEKQAVLQPIDTSPKTGTNSADLITVFNLDTDIEGYGFKPFYGNIRVNDPSIREGDTFSQNGDGKKIPYPTFVKGMSQVLPDAVGDGQTVAGGYSTGDFKGLQSYDFTGYQIASAVEVVQFVIHGNGVLCRTNDAGMRADGKLVDSTKWSWWKRL